MSLREDTEFYCLLWLGMVTLGSYYFNVFYLSATSSTYLSAIGSLLPVLLGAPLMLVFLFVGYLKPARGRIKMNMLALAVIVMVFYAIMIAGEPTGQAGGMYTAFWGAGSSLLVAGALAIRPSLTESTSRGMLDVSKLKYPPEPPTDSAE
ncbi:MAG: hypothetical protein HXY34_06950 [Candidatus Thorarchaeota archaeon]|nr:hypothetical protein [Candidatus Thorarchaeota archaeon]